jgi:DNA repair exonuclease SbcCD ATPase subunit
MKRTIALLSLLAASRAAAGIPVYDYVHSAISQINQTANYVEYVNQTIQQAEQLTNQVEELKRLGDFSSIRDLAGLDDFYADLNKGGSFDSISRIAEQADGAKLLQDTANGLFEPIGSTFKAGGKEHTRDTTRYQGEAALTESVNRYQELRAANDERRQSLRRAVAEAQAQAQTATTEAEAVKAQATVRALQEQLDAVDREDAAASREIAVLETRIEAQRQAEATARAEENAQEWEEAAGNLSDAYQLPEIKPDPLEWKR